MIKLALVFGVAFGSASYATSDLSASLFVRTPGVKSDAIPRIMMPTAPNQANRRRSKRVMLRMKILVLAEDTRRKRQQLEALTQVVNAHGGLMKMQRELHVGQPMLLVNPQNKVEQSCRVVRIEDTADGDFAVAFEFDKPNPRFWPVVFPPEDWHVPAPDPSQQTAT